MKSLKFEELTELTGYRYNMFGKTLEHIGRDEEHRKIIKADKDKVINFADEEESEKWLKEIELEVELGRQSIELTTDLYQLNLKNIIASVILLIISLICVNLFFSLLFLLPIVFFGIRTINLIKAYNMQYGFLQIGIWVLKENVKKTYDPSNKISFNIGNHLS